MSEIVLNDELLRTLVDEVIRRAEEQSPRIRLIPGTAVRVHDAVFSITPGVINQGFIDVDVIVDGDSAPITCRSLCCVPGEGERVMVLFNPPSGSFVLAGPQIEE